MTVRALAVHSASTHSTEYDHLKLPIVSQSALSANPGPSENFSRFFFSLTKCCKKISRIWETPNFSTDADNSTNICFDKKLFKKIQSGTTPCFKALRVGPQMHQLNTVRCEPFMGAIWNNSLFLRLYESVDKCTSPLVEHLPIMVDPCMQSRITPCFLGSSESVDKTLPSSHAWTS